MTRVEGAPAARLSALGRWGLALLAAHTAFLFLPPVPPIHNGSSVPGYALSLLVAALLALEVRRRAPAILAWWRARAAAALRAVAAGAIAAILALALALRAALPEPFRRFSREEGLWEPLTLVCYLGAVFLVSRASAGLDPRARRPWRLLAALYVWLALEEVDYFGMFGGLIGRIEGEYVGSLHDVIRLTALGIMGLAAWAVMIGIVVVVLVLLWRGGYVETSWMIARLADPRIVWAITGLLLLGAASAEEAHFFGWAFTMPTPEEAIELAGAACLAVYALDVAATAQLSAQPPAAPPSQPFLASGF